MMLYGYRDLELIGFKREVEIQGISTLKLLLNFKTILLKAWRIQVVFGRRILEW